MSISAAEFAANSFLGNIGAPLNHGPLRDDIESDDFADAEDIDLDLIDVVGYMVSYMTRYAVTAE